jgi:DNA-directed RNA polymerase subunit RPC12/RpoP
LIINSININGNIIQNAIAESEKRMSRKILITNKMAVKVSKCSVCSSTRKGHRIYTCSKCKRKYCDGNKTAMFGDCPHCGHGVYTVDAEVN